jgi:hypothetical protein
MRKKLFLLAFLAIHIAAAAQVVQPAGLFSRVDYSFSQYADRTENNHNLPVRFTQQSYLIKGETVLGSPFLFWDWNNGLLKTPDGREYHMKFKYDVFNQALHYNDGKDSMEVNEPVAEFSLQVKEGNGDQLYTFKKTEAFGKTKNKGFYEVVKEGKNVTLLKYYKMQVASLTYNIGNSASNKSFDLKYSYWLYTKADNKVTELKGNFKDILNYSKLSAGQQQSIDALNLDYNKETDAVQLIKAIDGQ